MKTNIPAKRPAIYTHEGAKAYQISDAQALNRSVMACMLWEDSFYEDGESITDRIAELVPKCTPETVAGMAIKAREEMKLRHVPLLLCVEMARHKSYSLLVRRTVERVIQRADELAEILAIYAKRNGHDVTSRVTLNKTPDMKLANSLKKGIAAAFLKFDEYQLAKYDRAGAFKLRDALFLSHAKPKDKAQVKLWKKLVNGELKTPDTWEVGISATEGEGKTEEWMRLLKEDKLGPLALLRNLRNLREAGIKDEVIGAALDKMKTERILPFRFITAARYNPTLEPWLETAMYRCLKDVPKLKGRNLIVIDHSGSMDAKLSAKSELTRFDAAAALAILLRELAPQFGCLAFSTDVAVVPPRRGFALRDAIANSMEAGGTNTDRALNLANTSGYDRIIVITDEQSHESIRPPLSNSKAYFVNVDSAKNGIGYGKWTHIDGFSESIIDFIQTFERETA